MSRPTETERTYDLAVVEAMAAELEPYLKSDLLFWQLSPAVPLSPPAPMLTLGGYRLRAHRLRGRRPSLSAAQRSRLDVAEATYQQVTQQWAVRTRQRVEREIGARLNSWQWFVDDCQERKRSCITYYATEAEPRTILAHLFELGGQDAQRARLARLDTAFRLCFKPGEFVWRPDLAPIYPRDAFWWLYGRPDFPA